MVIVRRFAIMFFPLACQVGVATASPTSNEFLPCHQMASLVLRHCLDEHPGSRGGNCWDRAKKTNDTCYADVHKSHRPDPATIEAKKKATREAIEKFKQEKDASAGTDVPKGDPDAGPRP